MNRLAPFAAVALLPALFAVSACGSFEDDVATLCNPDRACPSVVASTSPGAERQRALAACLASKLRTSKGKELFKAISVTPDGPDMLGAVAEEVGLASCPLAEQPRLPVSVATAPAHCEPFKRQDDRIALVLDDVVWTGDRRVLMKLPPNAQLGAGFAAEHKVGGKADSLVVEPIVEGLTVQRKLKEAIARAKGHERSAPTVYLYVRAERSPLPARVTKELVHSARKAGAGEVVQVFVGNGGAPRSVRLGS